VCEYRCGLEVRFGDRLKSNVKENREAVRLPCCCCSVPLQLKARAFTADRRANCLGDL
jgi:hypothetical protein